MDFMPDYDVTVSGPLTKGPVTIHLARWWSAATAARQGLAEVMSGHHATDPAGWHVRVRSRREHVGYRALADGTLVEEP